MEKVALITGGSRGIGLGIAIELAKTGFNLAINGMRDKSSISETLEVLKRFGTEVIYIQGDVSCHDDRTIMINKTLSHFGQLNILVNNAGVAPRKRLDILEASEESFDYILDVNLKGPYFLTQLAANQMVQLTQNEPDQFCCIINISSISATVASVNRGDYCISKAGLNMATKLWASRLGEFEIPVYEISPGIISTDLTAPVQKKYDQLFEQGLAIQKRWGKPEDIGRVAAAMSNQSMPYSTGQVVMVDGGMTVQRL